MKPVLLFSLIAIGIISCKKNTSNPSFNPRATFAGPPYADTVELPLIIDQDKELSNY